MITLQTLPVDALLHIGTFLQNPSRYMRIRDIDEITLAAILNDREMLEHYLKKHRPFYISPKVALSGNFSALKWVIKLGYPMDDETCAAVAWTGKLEMLKWLRSQGCPWDEDTSFYAAASGNLDMVRWLHSGDCPWHTFVVRLAALEHQRLEVLQWLDSADL